MPTCMGYNALLEAHAREGKMDAAAALVEDMNLSGVRPALPRVCC